MKWQYTVPTVSANFWKRKNFRKNNNTFKSPGTFNRRMDSNLYEKWHFYRAIIQSSESTSPNLFGLWIWESQEELSKYRVFSFLNSVAPSRKGTPGFQLARSWAGYWLLVISYWLLVIAEVDSISYKNFKNCKHIEKTQ